MRGLRWRTRRQPAPAELDVTPFMNLMIVLVPVLLLSLVFTHTAVIEIDLPGQEAGPADPAALHLEVVFRADRLVVRDGRGGELRSIPNVDGRPDVGTLGEVLRAIKARIPDKREVTLLMAPETDYQALVSVMDTVRSYPTVVAGSLVEAALFPVISLGDAEPEDAT